MKAFLRSRNGLVIQFALIAALTVLISPRFLWQPFAVAAVAALLAWLARDTRPELGLGRPQASPWRWIGESIVIGMLWQFIVSGLLVPGLSRLLDTSSATANRQGDWSYFASGALVYGVLHVIAKGFAYRAFLLNRAEALFGVARLGVGLSFILATLLFGLSNTQQSVIGLLVSTSAGAVFNALYYLARRNVWPSLLAHSAYNVTAFALSFLGLL